MTTISEAIPSFGAPTLEGFDTNNVTPGERVRGANRQYVRFFWKKEPEVYAVEAIVNEKTGSAKVTKTAVREVLREMVHIKTPGDPNEVEDHAADFHKREHWRAYKAFRDGKTGPIGTDIDECTSYISPHLATELRYRGVHTEEQLADASDLLCGQIPEGFSLREFARARCKTKKSNENTQELNTLREQLASQAALISQLQEQMNKGSGVLFSASGEAMAISEDEAPKRRKRTVVEKPLEA